MHALITTPRYLLRLDLTSRDVVVLEEHRPEYYGVSWFPEDEHLVLAHSAVDHASLVDLESYARSETGFVSRGTSASRPFLSAPHQLLCASDGRVVCTNTGRNAVSIMDLRHPDVVQELRFSEHRWDRLGRDDFSGDHLNSVFERDGLLYVVGHGLGKDSFIGVVSYPQLDVLEVVPVPGRTGLHNIWVTGDGAWIVCDSNRRQVVDLTSGDVLFHVGRPNTYTRGLAAAADFVLVGESTIATRLDRRTSTSAVWALDRRDWSVLDYFILGPYGSVHDVRLVDVPDDAHHGSVFAGSAALTTSSLYDRQRDERIEISRRARDSAEIWRPFRVVYGQVAFEGPTARPSDPTETCLFLVDSVDDEFTLEFEYALCARDAHVGMVVDYRGAGADRDMLAVILQSDGQHATLTRLRHEGAWTHEDTKVLAPTADAHLRGQLRVDVFTDHAVVHVDGIEIMTVPRSRGLGSDVGIRWTDAELKNPSIRPAAATQHR